METPSSPPLPPLASDADLSSTANPTSGVSNPTVEDHTKPNSTPNTMIIKKKMKNKKGKKVSSDPPQQSPNPSSSSCSTNLSRARSKGIRLSGNRRNPRVVSSTVSQRLNTSEADALALPLGMSIAAFVAQVLERKDATREKMSVDHLSKICTLAVKESLANVFGNKFGFFVSNFERSFESTLTTLRAINESSNRSYLPREDISTCNSSQNDSHFDNNQELTSIDDELNLHKDFIHHELTVFNVSRNNQELACVSSNTVNYNNQSMLSTLERSVSEQARSNDLKAVEIGLTMKKMKLKEAQIAVDCDSNVLERFKLSMGISKANFRAEKFKMELEDSRHAELLKKCVDCLVAGLMIMLAGLAYGTYVHSHQRLIEATESCMPIKGSNSWWIPKPMSSFSTGFQILRCQVQVISRMLFGVLMIIAITYLLIQRSGTTNQTMPVTFILLLLGIGCGFAGKFCIDTLGGSGNHWLFYWEALCLLHFLSNVFTSKLFFILHGPVTVTQKSIGSELFPYWIRRSVFYATLLVYLPLLCGLIPFAGPGEWYEHFVSLMGSHVSE